MLLKIKELNMIIYNSQFGLQTGYCVKDKFFEDFIDLCVSFCRIMCLYN